MDFGGTHSAPKRAGGCISANVRGKGGSLQGSLWIGGRQCRSTSELNLLEMTSEWSCRSWTGNACLWPQDLLRPNVNFFIIPAPEGAGESLPGAVDASSRLPRKGWEESFLRRGSFPNATPTSPRAGVHRIILTLCSLKSKATGIASSSASLWLSFFIKYLHLSIHDWK